MRVCGCVGAVGELQTQLQQEQTASRDLRHSLEEVGTRSTNQHRQLEAEQKLVMEMKVKLEERTQQLHLSSKSQEELQAQIHKLRYAGASVACSAQKIFRSDV